MECEVRTPNLRLEPRVCVAFNVQTRENVTCEVYCSQPPVGCSRLLSAVCKRSDNNKQKNLQSLTSGQLCEEALQVLYAALSRAQMCLIFDEL